ncbi:MAG: hypothetical protein A3B70_02545 [Deltaproteobacteria bacterium RIFCSPHIGHO2_02_FULL_40_11]|nr:MAG: hypothetical protein A3B70_02545 [Deltaproteobacteria bacterium RIFCSPHIGHO2_02_FULL_40_11]
MSFPPIAGICFFSLYHGFLKPLIEPQSVTKTKDEETKRRPHDLSHTEELCAYKTILKAHFHETQNAKKACFGARQELFLFYA